MKAVQEVAGSIKSAAVCRALGLSRATFYRYRQPDPAQEQTSTPGPSASEEVNQERLRLVADPACEAGSAHPRALSFSEKQAVLDALHSERFVDEAPAEVYAALLDEGVYHCSISTMYRLLKTQDQVRERRNLARHPSYARPELLATRPNEVWSWDITKLLGPAKWTYYYLYVILDVFSRYVVGWMLAPKESADLAEQLLAETCHKQDILPGQLTVHADRGSSMKSKPVALLLSDLGVAKTHSRPHVSNDNPFSESQFKTLKYRGAFPSRFASLEETRAFCQEFFAWYNQEHHHGGIALLTPVVVHYGKADAVIAARQETLEAAYALHPERFVRQLPRPQALPEAVWINPPEKETAIAKERA